MTTDQNPLAQRYETLLGEAKRFQRALERFRSVELILLKADSLVEVIRVLLGHLPQRFELEEVRLYLIDTDARLADYLGAEEQILEQSGLVRLANQRLLEHLFSNTLDVNLHCDLLHEDNGIRSRAVVPLRRHSQLQGVLTLGSRDTERFRPEYGHDLLEHFASIVSVCIENSLTQEDLRMLSMRDPLTQVWNRRFLDQALEEESLRARRDNAPLSLMLADLDHFKKINDTYGHPVGDQALKAVTRIIREEVRQADIIARYGGEEFAILLPSCPETHASSIAQSICEAIANKPVRLSNGRTLRITLSIGLATYLPAFDIDEPLQLLKAADEALYRAKRAGRNQIALFSDGHQHDEKTTLPLPSIFTRTPSIPRE